MGEEFKNMGIDRKNLCTIIKSEKLNFTTEPILIDLENSKENGVKINLKRENGVIRIIQVICSCGNKINLLCEYENEDVPKIK